jgi:hypothetical protein
MSITKAGESYQAGKGRSSKLQPKIHPLPILRRPWFRNRIVCDEGWSVAFSGSSWRIDRYDYFEDGKHLILGGEGACGMMEILLESDLVWDDPPYVRLDDATRERVLHNITAALQWAGFSVGFILAEGGSE